MSSVAAFEAVIWVKSVYIIKSWWKTKKGKIWKSKKSIHKSSSKRRFWNGIYSWL